MLANKIKYLENHEAANESSLSSLITKWISTNDKLPETDSIVIAMIESSPSLICSAIYAFGCFQYNDPDTGEFRNDCAITHWIPMPSFGGN